MKKTTEQFKNEVSEATNGLYWFEGDYINNSTYLLFHCNVCGNKWLLKPIKFVNGRRCPNCAKIKRTKSNETFINQVYKQTHGEYTFLEKYINNYTKIKVKHNICNREYFVTPHNFLDMKNRCPFCSHSIGEEKIVDFLTKNNISYIREYRPDWIKPNRYRYDFYIYEQNLIIEYNGIPHYEDNKWFKTLAKEYQKIDKYKKEKALENGYNYLIIPYWELDNIETILSKRILKGGI
jgi:hypothetical protein